MQSLTRLEASTVNLPNSIEINEALAKAYVEEGRWKDAVRIYQALQPLYPQTAALFINRIHLGALALMISSVAIFVAGVIFPVLSDTQITTLVSALGSPAYLAAQLLFLLALVFYSCAAISLYKLLSYTRDHRPAFWAMVCSLVGVGLSLPSLGVHILVMPLISDLYLKGSNEMMGLYASMHQDPIWWMLQVGHYILVAGITVFAWVIWRNRTLSLTAILMYLAGWVAYALLNIFQWQEPFTEFMGVLMLAGGLGLSRSLWQQASTQFTPAMDQSRRS